MLTNSNYRYDIHECVSRIPKDFFLRKHILVTGANGLIGSCLVDALIYMNDMYNLEIEIYILVRDKISAEKRFNTKQYTNIKIIHQDIRDPLLCNDRIDFVINAASNAHPRAYAVDPIGTLLGNILGLNNILKFSAKNNVQMVIELSSSEVYGEREEPNFIFKENEYGIVDCNKVRASYPEGKRACEALCQGYIDQYGLDIKIIRPGRVYGPTMTKKDSKAIAQFINKALKKEDIILKSSGQQEFSFIYVVDMISAIFYVMIYGEKGEAYNVADEYSNIKLESLAKKIAEYAKVNVVYELADDIEKKGFSNSPGMILDNTKLANLGWCAKSDINSGIKKTLHILKNN